MRTRREIKRDMDALQDEIDSLESEMDVLERELATAPRAGERKLLNVSAVFYGRIVTGDSGPAWEPMPGQIDAPDGVPVPLSFRPGPSGGALLLIVPQMARG